MITHPTFLQFLQTFAWPSVSQFITKSYYFSPDLELDVEVSGEIEDGDHDECEVDPQVIAKHYGKRVLYPSIRVVYLQRAPARVPMGRVA